METYIKCNKNDTNLSHITYMSELIPAVSLCEAKRNKAAGINSPKQLTVISFRKLWAH